MEKIVKDELTKIFPISMRMQIEQALDAAKGLEEIRLRVGKPPVFIGGTSRWMPQVKCLQSEDFEEMMLYLCEYSKYAFAPQLSDGFLVLPGGIRVGMAGESYCGQGGQASMQYVRFLNIRIPSQQKGCCNDIYAELVDNRSLWHTLLVSPPGAGKTTLLKDIIRRISNEDWCRGLSVIDARYELAACYQGVPMNDLGQNTDVYSGCSKEKGLLMAIRTMAPQVVAVDEIGGEEDRSIVQRAMQSGISVLATYHGKSIEDYEALGLPFERLVFIKRCEDGKRQYQVVRR